MTRVVRYQQPAQLPKQSLPQRTTPPSQCLTIKHTAERLDSSKQFMVRLIKTGLLQAHRIGKRRIVVLESGLTALIEAGVIDSYSRRDR
jgi:hypothetical protein